MLTFASKRQFSQAFYFPTCERPNLATLFHAVNVDIIGNPRWF